MVIAPPSIVLPSSSGGLTLTPDERAWSQVYLTAPGVNRPLGAERLKYIAAHLVSFLADNRAGRRWVLSLSELHTSTYGEHVGGEVALLLQDANGTMFRKLVLSGAEKNEWLQRLLRHANT